MGSPPWMNFFCCVFFTTGNDKKMNLPDNEFSKLFSQREFVQLTSNFQGR